MNKLIDADRLMQLVIDTLTGIARRPEMTLQEVHVIAAMKMLGEMINDSPAVEAIPVNYIRVWLGEESADELIADYWSEYGQSIQKRPNQARP